MKIGIIGAMEAEVVLLRDSLQQSEVFSIAGNNFYLGELAGHQIILLQCGIGKVNAAIGTTLLIEHFKPDYIINTGTAGGLNSMLQIGDVIISIEVRHHDVDLTVFGYEHGQLPQLPAAFLPNILLVEAAERAAHKMDMHVTRGLIASGDSFIHEEAHIEKIREKFPDIDAVEMEAAAIAQVCHQFNMPFVIIRALSDIAGKDSLVSFSVFLEQASINSAQLILYTLEELV